MPDVVQPDGARGALAEDASPTLWLSHVWHATNLAQSIFGIGHTAEAAFAAPAAAALALAFAQHVPRMLSWRRLGRRAPALIE